MGELSKRQSRVVDKSSVLYAWMHGDEVKHYGFWCPGCKGYHHFDIRPPSPIWTFNGNYEKPTFEPSLLYSNPPRCHLFLRDGIIEFLGDCDHDLRGKKVPLPQLPRHLSDT